MGKTSRFDPDAGNSAPDVPFNPVFAEGLAALKSAVVTPPALATETVAEAPAPIEGEGESVVDALAGMAADNTVDTSASSGDVAPAGEVSAPRPPKTHRGKGPHRDVATKVTPDTQTPKQDRLTKEIPIEHFCEFPDVAIVALIAAIRDGGAQPIVSLRASSDDEASSITFGLALLPGRECERVGMTIVGGEGVFRAVFGRCRFFRDELFGYREPPPDRMAPTTSLRHLLDFVRSLPKA